MKICPRCQKTYADDNLNFCLEDGSVLMQAPVDPEQTVRMDEPRATQGQQPMPSQPGAQPAWNTAPQQQQYSMQPAKKSSKTWIWVLLILFVVVLVCGGGFGGLVYMGYKAEREKQSNFNISTSSTPSKNTATNGNKSSTNSATNSDRTSVDNIDLEKWVQTDQVYGTTDFDDDELTMASRKKGFYYVLAGSDKEISVNADSQITVRNINSEATTIGYGLVFHSSTTPLQQGYALLIDSVKKRYRVVHHSPGKEDDVVKWTSSPAILDGSQPNTLEVRDKPDGIDLYINGTKVNSIKNVFGYPNGVVGIYAGDGIKVAFKDLEIRK